MSFGTSKYGSRVYMVNSWWNQTSLYVFVPEMTGICICLIAWFIEPWLVEVWNAGDFSFRVNKSEYNRRKFDFLCYVTTVSSFHHGVEGISESDLISNRWKIGDSIYRLICGSQRVYILSCCSTLECREKHTRKDCLQHLCDALKVTCFWRG